MEPEQSQEQREQVVIKDNRGRFLPGSNANPNGRPKGSLSIKGRIQKRLQENPEEMDKFVEYFVKHNRDLAWQMLEGRPHQSADVDVKLPQNLIDLMKHGSSDQTRDTELSEEDQ